MKEADCRHCCLTKLLEAYGSTSTNLQHGRDVLSSYVCVLTALQCSEQKYK
jgi:hypothetical protein